MTKRKNCLESIRNIRERDAQTKCCRQCVCLHENSGERRIGLREVFLLICFCCVSFLCRCRRRNRETQVCSRDAPRPRSAFRHATNEIKSNQTKLIKSTHKENQIELNQSASGPLLTTKFNFLLRDHVAID